MKKLLPFACILFSVCFFGCDMIDSLKDASIPESVSVKSVASYELPAGEMNVSVREQIGIQKLRDILEENIDSEDETKPLPTVYDYNPNRSEFDTFTYIINYPIIEIPLSLKSKETGEEIDTDIGDTITFATDFELPDLSEKIKGVLNVAPQHFSMVEAGSERRSISDLLGDALYLTFDITDPDFATMTLRSGKLILSVTPDDAASISADFTLNLEVSLVEATTKKVIATSAPVDCAKGGVITLELGEAKLVKNMLLLIGGSAQGGSPTSGFHPYTVKTTTQDIDLEEITGLNMDLGDDATVLVKNEFELDGLNAKLKTASIKDGSLSFECDLPDGWTGVTCTDTFMLYGGITCADTEFTDLNDGTQLINRKADLAGKTLTPAPIYTFNPADAENKDTCSSITIALADATIIFAESGATTVTLNGVFEIVEIGEILIDIGELEEFSDSIETGLNLSTLLDNALGGQDGGLMDDIKFTGLEAYVYITQPLKEDFMTEKNNFLSRLELSGHIRADYTTSDGTVTHTYLVGEEDKDDSLKIVNTGVSLASLAAENKQYEIQSDVLFTNDEYYSGKVKDRAMDTIINNKPSDLAFAYALEMTGNVDGNGNTVTEVSFTQRDLDFIKESKDATLSVSIAIVLPLQIVFEDNSDGNPEDNTIIIDDVLALTGSEITEDLLNRNSAADQEDMKKYVEAIETVALNYTVINSTQLDKLQLYFIDTGGSNLEDKTLEMTSGSHSLTLKGAEVLDILNTYPFTPALRLELGDANGKTPKPFKRNSQFTITMSLLVKTNGSIEVWNKND